MVIFLKEPFDIVRTISDYKLEKVTVETTEEDNYYDQNKNIFFVTKSFLAEKDNVFKNLDYVKIIDLRHFDFSQIKIMDSWFANCTNLEIVLFPNNANFSNVKSLHAMFYNTKIKTLNMANWKFSNAIVLGSLVASCTDLKSLYLPDAEILSVRGIAQGCTSLKYVHLGKGIIQIKKTKHSSPPKPYSPPYEYAFYGCKNLNTIDCSELRMSPDEVAKFFNDEDSKILNKVAKNCVIVLP